MRSCAIAWLLTSIKAYVQPASTFLRNKPFSSIASGVVCVLTAKDIPGTVKIGHLKQDYDVMIPEGAITHFLGDAIALVAAETEEQARAYLRQTLPTLDYWRRHEELSDGGRFEAFKQTLIDEINALRIAGMPTVEKLNALVGSYVNLAYPLPSGVSVRFLDDGTTYLGNQLTSETDSARCFGVLANADFILVSTYAEGGAEPELVLYKKR